MVWVRRVIEWMRRPERDQRLNDEIESHLAMLADQFTESGMDAAAARQAARREFGGVLAMRERYREQSGLPWLEAFQQDVRLAVRSLCRDRLLATVCVLSLGLATGAGTAIFSVFEAAVLRPLPFPDSERLVMVFETSKGGRGPVSLPNATDWRDQSQAFSGLSAWSSQSMALSGNGPAERVSGGFVSAGFFSMLGAKPAMGSLELRPATRQAVLSHRLWQNRFGSRQDIVGESLLLNGEAYLVTGVLEEDFRFPMGDLDVWVPEENYATSMALARDMRVFFALGRLRPGADAAAASANLRVVAERLQREHAKENAGRGVVAVRWRDVLSEGIRDSLRYMIGAVALLLLVACANVAGLLTARAAKRQDQFALQTALGAPRARILRQVISEGLFAGLAGGTVGLLLAHPLAAILLAMLPANAAPAGASAIHGPVLAFCLVVSVASGLLSGLLPALRVPAPGEGNLRSTARSAGRLREWVLAAQAAVSMILLTGAAGMAIDLLGVLRADIGIRNMERVLTMEYRVNRAKFASRRQQWEFHRQVEEGVRAIPGVREAALARAVPYSGNGGSVEFQLAGGTDGVWSQAVFNTVTSGYFDAMGIALLQGRSCTAQDVDDGPTAVLINDKLATHLWPGAAALGRQIVIRDFATATVAGVVSGNRQNNIRHDAPWQIYGCYSQNPGTLAAIVLRTDGDMRTVAEEAKKVVWRIDRDQAVWKVRTLQSLVDMQTLGQRTVVLLISVFAGFALCLALAGAFGMANYDAVRRLRETGIRMALGASRMELFLQPVARTAVLATAGICVGGAVGPLVLRRILDVSPPVVVVAGCGAVFVALALLAAARPGLLALRRNPVEVLRHE